MPIIQMGQILLELGIQPLEVVVKHQMLQKQVVLVDLVAESGFLLLTAELLALVPQVKEIAVV